MVLSGFYFVLIIPINHLVSREAQWVSKQRLLVSVASNPILTLSQHPRSVAHGVSAREQLRRRGSF
jgi:hypothetical protein